MICDFGVEICSSLSLAQCLTASAWAVRAVADIYVFTDDSAACTSSAEPMPSLMLLG